MHSMLNKFIKHAGRFIKFNTYTRMHISHLVSRLHKARPTDPGALKGEAWTSTRL